MDNSEAVLILFFLALTVYADAVFCYRRFDDVLSRDAVCRGLMSNDIMEYSSIEDCCSHEKAVAFSNELIRFGRRNKKYQCSPCPEETSIDFFDNREPAGWSDWGSWTPCSETCRTGFRTRQRICYGNETICPGEEKESEPCVMTPQCPVVGKWGIWTEWTECTTSCNNGTRTRSRACNSPPPQYGGAECDGLAVEMDECNTQHCPINGSWSDWTNEPCSVTCGKGTFVRTRTCSDPVPQHGGTQCMGRDTENARCSLDRCPRHGDWSFWSAWSECSVTCGDGERSRTRACNSPSPKFGGEYCVGNTTEIQTCFKPEPCPIGGGWSEWTVWGPCYAAPCGGERGLERRVRDCTAPYPRFGGEICGGNATELRYCYNNYGCPVDGGWCDWDPWTDCIKQSGIIFMRRTRRCECPSPTNGGSYCFGTDFYISKYCDDPFRTEGSGFLGDDTCDDEENGC